MSTTYFLFNYSTGSEHWENFSLLKSIWKLFSRMQQYGEGSVITWKQRFLLSVGCDSLLMSVWQRWEIGSIRSCNLIFLLWKDRSLSYKLWTWNWVFLYSCVFASCILKPCLVSIMTKQYINKYCKMPPSLCTSSCLKV